MNRRLQLLFSFLLITCLSVQAQVAELDYNYTTGTSFNSEVRASAIQSDGKVIIGGSFISYNGITRNYIARLNTDGTLDLTFDPGVGINHWVYGIAIQPSDGKIVVIGTFGQTIARLETNGTLDGTFALEGTGFDNVVTAIAIQSDGKFIVGGNFTTYNSVARSRILRLNSDGTLDGTFTPGAGFNDHVRAIAIQSDGKIVAGGDFTSIQSDLRAYVARLNTNGNNDLTFVPLTAALGKVYSVAIQSDGKIVIGGLHNSGGGALRRLSSTGAGEIAATANSLIKVIKIQSDGKILFGGWFTKGLSRLNADGTNDPTIYSSGMYGFEGPAFAVNTLAIQSDGKIVTGGTFTSFNGLSVTNFTRLRTCTSVVINSLHANSSICDGNNTSFTIDASAGYTYKWQFNTVPSGAGLYSDVVNGGVYAGAATSTLTLTGVTLGMTGYYYRCLISDGTCTTTTIAKILSVSAIPVINTHPVNTTRCVGAGAVFTVAATNPGGYQWQEDSGSGFVDISGANSATLVTSTNSMVGYKYRCRVGICSPPIYSNEATLTAISALPEITQQPPHLSLCDPTSTTFGITATGTGLTYQWQYYVGSSVYANLANGSEAATNYKWGGTYSGVNSPTIALSGITPTLLANVAIYRCIVTNADGCVVISSTNNNYLYSAPTISTHPSDVSKCAGASGNITFNVTVTSPPSGLTYQWQEKVGAGAFANVTNGGIYSGATGTTLTLTGTGITGAMDGNQYRCIVGTCTPSVISFAGQLTVDSPPVITLNPFASTICEGMNTTFTADGTGIGLTFQWQQQPGGIGSYVNIVNGGIYSGATTGTLTLTNVPLSESLTRYRCVLTASGVCTPVNTSIGQITVRPIPTINTQPADNAKCEGLTVNLNSNTSNAFSAHQWQIDTGSGFVDMVNTTEYPNVFSQNLSFIALPSQNGNKYRLKVGSCTPLVFSNEATVTVYATPTITTEPVAATICESGDAIFEVVATGTSLVYQWRKGGAAIGDGTVYSGVTTSKLTITGFTGSSSEFTCTITGESGCLPVTTTPAILTVDQIQITDHPTQVAAFCEGGNATFSVTATGQTLGYQWEEMNNGVLTELVDGGVYAGATSNTLSLTNVPFSMNGRTYRCVVSGCGVDQVSSFAGLPVNQIPTKPIIIANLSNPEAPTLSASGGSTYQWFKNGTAISGSTSSNYTVTSEGSYTVQVTVNGCLSPISDPYVIIITGDLGDIATSDVQVYPNPVVDRLTISLSNFNIAKPVAVSITDMLGRSIEQSSVIGKTSIDVDVSPYKQGQYIVRLQQAQRTVVTKFIKSNQ